jgi:TPR repeat protein
MPALKDLLKKKEKIAENAQPVQPSTLDVPEFKIIRTTTESEEIIQPPDDPVIQPDPSSLSPQKQRDKSKEHKHHFGFRKSANAEVTKDPTAVQEQQQLPVRPKEERRISSRLHFHRQSRTPSAESSSANLPQDLPNAPTAVGPVASEPGDAEEVKEVNQQREAQWERRATILAQNNKLLEQEVQRGRSDEDQERARSRSKNRNISEQRADDDIQEAIRLHEIGELRLSTDMFGRLGDPQRANNALAQVLYGLALRHGWGVEPEPEKAIHYLSLAASNSASIEKLALESGMKKGGSAKGELVLAIFELANCFRHGWGVKKDAVAARQYYDTAANLGDTDAMEEAAWCYLQGFGGGKDKVRFSEHVWLPKSFACTWCEVSLHSPDEHDHVLTHAGPQSGFGVCR